MVNGVVDCVEVGLFAKAGKGAPVVVDMFAWRDDGPPSVCRPRSLAKSETLKFCWLSGEVGAVRNPSWFGEDDSASKVYGGGGGSLGFSSAADVCDKPDPLAPGVLLFAGPCPPQVPSS